MVANASTISIKLDGVDISDRVVYKMTSFDSQAYPMQGSFKVTVRDPNQDFSVTAGQTLTCHIDGVPLFGGYVFRIGRGSFLDAADTSQPVQVRKVTMSGPDFNAIFDKRVIYDPSNPTVSPKVPKGKRTIRAAFIHFMENYIDVPSGLDYRTYADVIRDADGSLMEYGSEDKGSMYVGSSKYWRDQMDDFHKHSGITYYIDADFNLHMHAYEKLVSRIPISDVHAPTMIPFREGEYEEDAMRFITEAHVWGGSSLKVSDGGTGGEVVYAKYPSSPASGAREQEALDRMNLYGKWQMGEEHAGQSNYLTQKSVNTRAKIIISGPTGTVPTYGIEGGYSAPLKRFTCTWFAHDVPGKAHIRPGTLQDIILYTMGMQPVRLPLRSMSITFPTLPTDNPGGETFVQFSGEFALAYSDSRYLWTFLRENKLGFSRVSSVVDNFSDSAIPGSLATVWPEEKCNDTRKSFTFPFTFYLNRFDLYLNGILQRFKTDYTYSAATKQVTFVTAPGTGDQIYAIGYVSE